MAKKKRSEIFAEKSRERKTSPYQKHDRNKRRNIRKKKNKRNGIIRLLVIGILIISPFFLYEKFYNTPQRSIDKAVLSIKEQDIKAQEKYFDKVSKINKVLSESYSSELPEQKEFLKANYANLKVSVKDIKKASDGLEVEVDVKNVCYIDVFDTLNPKDKNLHKSFVRELSNENQTIEENTAKLILDKKLSYYKIYESRDFINAILGGALKYADKNK
ncbi:hypothetical protein HV819_03745 [Anaerococcus sp. AGMB00486]|uniref:Uncharacterized protein n=1 Tax=Anaerococcus faecalis TaxID=2742993 RepID=A0ABX2N8T5_9FIRM|nr:hypothetical protein [Anaerococcus faecalis]NVF11105.1 hypothetical protein [Anaerococcus faecalis]